ncbi:MAG: HEPN domain-containing protein [Methanobrevibacter sp.]|nr:HEPN domain-containing protein [Methanobrevibacter sp.]
MNNKIIEAWFSKAERHMDGCEIYFDLEEYPFIINSCFLAMYSVVKALFVLKNIECKTLEGLIYLLKIHYVDQGLFDQDLFKFFCKVKELNSEFLQIKWEVFDEKMALEIFNNTNVFIDYSKVLFDELSKLPMQ